MQQRKVEQDDAVVALARIEALLRAANRVTLQESFPDSWNSGRRRKILQFCAQPRTQQEIREHVGTIAGYGMGEYLGEGIQLGILACFGAGKATKYVAALMLRSASGKRGRKKRAKSNRSA
jgi:hypothetical protein